MIPLRTMTLALLLLAAAVGSTFLTAAPASAGVATIYQCRTPTGPADTDLMSTSGNPAIAVSLTSCASQRTWLMSAAQAGASFPVVSRSISMEAPGDTRFVGGTLHRQMAHYAYVDIDNGDADSW